MGRIKISFLERRFVSLNRTGDGVRGYEHAIIKTAQGTFEGRVIDTDRLKAAEQVENEIFSTFLDLNNKSFDLSLLLTSDEKGQIWMDSFRKYFRDYFGQEIKMPFSMRKMDFPFGAKYKLYPENIELISGGNSCPSGNITSLSDKVVYYEVLPPLKLNNNKYIPNLYYNRKVDDRESFFDCYSVLDPTGEHFSVAGCLLGDLVLGNIENRQGNFRKSFPLKHFLEVCYPVMLRDFGDKNPLSIKFELV